MDSIDCCHFVCAKKLAYIFCYKMNQRFTTCSLNGLNTFDGDVLSTVDLYVSGTIYYDGEALNTDVVPEGIVNLYYTDARVDTYVTTALFSNWLMDNTLSALTLGDLIVNDDILVGGNLTVNGTVTSIDSENVLIEDPHIYLNSNYTTALARTGGLVINYRPIGSAGYVDIGGFTAGVAGVSNPTVQTTTTMALSAGDLIQVSNSNNVANNGLYEVLTSLANVITIKGIGLTATVEDFTQNQFTTDTSSGGTIIQVTVAVLQTNTSGLWEVGSGSMSGITYKGLPTITGSGVDNYIVRFDGANGLQTSSCLILDSGELEIAGAIDTITATTMLIGTSNPSAIKIGKTIAPLTIDSPTTINRDTYISKLGVNQLVDSDCSLAVTSYDSRTDTQIRFRLDGSTVYGSLWGDTLKVVLGSYNTTGGVVIQEDGTDIAQFASTISLYNSVEIAGSVDTITATAMTIGGTNATAINIGAGIAQFASTISLYNPVEIAGSMDTITATAMTIGGTNATAINIGAAGVGVTLYETLSATGITGTGLFQTTGVITKYNGLDAISLSAPAGNIGLVLDIDSPTARYDIAASTSTGDFYMYDNTNARYMLRYDVSANSMELGTGVSLLTCVAGEFKATGSGGTSWLKNDAITLQSSGVASSLGIISADTIDMSATNGINLDSSTVITGDGTVQGEFLVKNTAGTTTYFDVTTSTIRANAVPLYFDNSGYTFSAPVVSGASDRIRFYDVGGGGYNYAMGVASGVLWTGYPSGNSYRVYESGTVAMELKIDSTYITGNITLASGSSKTLTIPSTGKLHMQGIAGSGETAYIQGPPDTAGNIAMLLNAGNGGIPVNKSTQLAFGYGGVGKSYKHRIVSGHNGGGDANNVLQFFTWDFGVDGIYDLGTFEALRLGVDQCEVFGDFKCGQTNGDIVTVGAGDVGASGALSAITIGSTGDASTTDIYSGSGNITLTSENGEIEMASNVIHSLPYAFAFVTWTGTSQSLTTSAAAYVQTATLQTGNNFSVNSTIGGIGSVECDGTYTLNYLVNISLAAYSSTEGVGWIMEGRVYKNGSPVTGGGFHRYFNGTTDHGSCSWTGIISLANGDYLSMYMYNLATPPTGPTIYLEHAQMTLTAVP